MKPITKSQYENIWFNKKLKVVEKSSMCGNEFVTALYSVNGKPLATRIIDSGGVMYFSERG